jgi:outer membrane biosynthesis protein TonB
VAETDASIDAAPPPLSNADVKVIVAAHFPRLRRCYDDIVADAGIDRQGVVTIGWSIRPDGYVEHVAVVRSSLELPAVERCLVNAISQWRFPLSDLPLEVEAYPFRFAR